MCLESMKYFVLVVIGLGVIDFVQDAFNLLPSLRVADIDGFAMDDAHI